LDQYPLHEVLPLLSDPFPVIFVYPDGFSALDLDDDLAVLHLV
jgi:hypothetical protein